MPHETSHAKWHMQTLCYHHQLIINSESQQLQSRHWVFTLNNPLEFEHTGAWLPDCEYWVIGRETAPGGTPHLQGYCVFMDRYRMTEITKKNAVCKRCHWEPQTKFSTPKQASDYCKKDGHFLEHGEWYVQCMELLATQTGEIVPLDKVHQGGAKTQKKWEDALQLAKIGRFDEIPAHIQIVFHSTLRKIHQDALLEMSAYDGELENYWYWGPPGSGKSLCARTKWPNCFLKGLNHWWCGYAGEDTVLIEEWELKSALFLGHHLKIWSDRYPFKPEVKGSSLPPQRPRRIVVTSNYSAIECFGADPTLLSAIERRFTMVDFGLVPYVYAAPVVVSPDRQPNDFT
nr:putative replication associated protein [Crucivirus sp.]QKV51068.1 putative replication associated protein [Crucivirus sp.]